MTEPDQVRLRRKELGLTQAELATSAGVSRQLVVALEAGVNTPAVDAAMRLARALECPVEELFEEARPEARRGSPQTGAPMNPQDGAFVIAGCDPALAIAEAMLRGDGSAAVLALDATTATALHSLRSGCVHAAVVHGRPGRLRRTTVDVDRVQLAHWQVGLGLAPGVKPRTLASCLERRVPIVQRQEGAASQQALRRAVKALDRDLPPGIVVAGHLEAARVAAAIGCAAITTEGAASMSGLRFVPFELHTVEIWVDRRWEGHRGHDALRDLLNTGAFAESVARLGGYDLTGCGEQLPPLAVG
jgi:DNA-binding XRE family transcriptional regulator